jgi:hypothetical protein
VLLREVLEVSTRLHMSPVASLSHSSRAVFGIAVGTAHACTTAVIDLLAGRVSCAKPTPTTSCSGTLTERDRVGNSRTDHSHRPSESSTAYGPSTSTGRAGLARLKSWRVFHRARCSPNRMSITAAVVTVERQR